METAEPQSGRRTRVDVALNRERLLAAAKTVFARSGRTASLDAVVRESGLGTGTLYRHFPTREALYEAVYRRDIEHLVELGSDAMSTANPVDALRHWLRAMIDTVATKKGMIAAFALSADTTSAISARSTGPLMEVVDRLIAHADKAGAIRAGISGEELLLAVVGMSMLRDQPDWQASVIRLTDILVDGMLVATNTRQEL